MEKKRNGRCNVVTTDAEGLMPADHLVRKTEAVMDYNWLYERPSPYCCEDNGRPGIDPVVLIKMALPEHRMPAWYLSMGPTSRRQPARRSTRRASVSCLFPLLSLIPFSLA